MDRSLPDYSSLRARVGWLSFYASGALALAALLIAVYADRILRLLFGPEFEEGSKILRMLAWALPIQGIRAIMRPAIFAFHLQRLDTRNLAFGVAANASFDLLLIPRWGAFGCAVSTIVSEVALLIGCQLIVSWKIQRRTQ